MFYTRVCLIHFVLVVAVIMHYLIYESSGTSEKDEVARKKEVERD